MIIHKEYELNIDKLQCSKMLVKRGISTMIKYIFGAIIIVFVFLFKPLTSDFIQDYASALLEQKVKVTSIRIIPLRAEAYIADSNNTISATIVSIFPFKIRAYYSGNIEAFKTYHPLKGHGEATADIYFYEKLLVEGQASLYGSNAKVTVKELKDNWYVGVKATSLNLKMLQEQNDKEVKAKAELDFNLNFYTDANTSIDIHTKTLDISGTQIKDIDLNLKYEKDNFTISSSFKPPNFYKTNLDANGVFKDGNISTSTNIAFKDVKLDIDELKIDTKTFQTSLQTSSLGGHLNATYKKDMLYYDANSLHLSKVLKATGQKPLARGYLNFKGKINTKTLDANLLFNSPWIVASKQRVQKIKLNIPNLKFEDKKLTSSYKLSASYMKKLFSFRGNIYYKDKLKLNAKSNNFKGKTELHLEDKEFVLSMKKLDLYDIQQFASLEPIARGLIDLDAKGNFDKINFKLSTDATIKEHNVSAQADGSYTMKSKLLKSNFKASAALQKESFKISGKASYKKHLKLNAHSSSFGSQTLLKLEFEHFTFYTHNMDLDRLASALKKPKVLFGLVDVEAEGNLENIDFKIRSEKLSKDIKPEDIDGYISVNLNGQYTPKQLTLKDTIVMHYNKENVPLKFKAKIELTPPYKSKGSLIYKQDKIVVNSLSYENEQVKSDFLVDINELYLYRAIMANNFRGPLKAKAQYTDALNITTNSLGGELKAELKKNNLNINIKEVNAKKVAYLIDKDDLLERGYLNGNATYNIQTKTAKTDITLTSALLNGVNIDEKISTLNDLMGLNVINMSKSLLSNFSDTNNSQTDIQHLQFDVSLKDNKVNIDDVALRTEKFLIVALGNLQENGDINSLAISIVDKNGCAIITQALSGNIKEPKTAQTTSTIVNIMQRVPGSILDTGRKLIDFSTQTIDDVASFGAQQILGTDKNISITSDIVSGGFSLINYTSNIIMPQGCSVIYNGKVKHPKNLKRIKDEKEF